MSQQTRTPSPTPTPTPLQKKIHTKLDKLAALGSKADPATFQYDPRPGIIYSYFLYLSEKYGKVCLPKRKPYPTQIFDLTTEELGSNRKQMARLEHTIGIFIENIMHCITEKKKTFVFPFIVKFRRSQHQNILIYRRNTRTLEENTIHTIEHFEPNASATLLTREEDYRTVNDFISIIVDHLREEYFGENLNFIEQTQTCPVGLQAIESKQKSRFKKEGGGYCVAWSALMTELVLENQEYDTKTITDIVLAMDPNKPPNLPNPPNPPNPPTQFSEYLRLIIRGYAMEMEKNLEKYYKKEVGLTKPVWEETDILLEKVQPIYTKAAKKGLSRRKKRQIPTYKQLFEDVSIYEESSPESVKSKTPKTKTPKTPKSKSPQPKYTRKTPPNAATPPQPPA